METCVVCISCIQAYYMHTDTNYGYSLVRYALEKVEAHLSPNDM